MSTHAIADRKDIIRFVYVKGIFVYRAYQAFIGLGGYFVLQWQVRVLSADSVVVPYPTRLTQYRLAG
jgi:hypothetical protein